MNSAIHPSTSVLISTRPTEQAPRIPFQPPFMSFFDSIFGNSMLCFQPNPASFLQNGGVGDSSLILDNRLNHPPRPVIPPACRRQERSGAVFSSSFAPANEPRHAVAESLFDRSRKPFRFRCRPIHTTDSAEPVTAALLSGSSNPLLTAQDYLLDASLRDETVDRAETWYKV